MSQRCRIHMKSEITFEILKDPSNSFQHTFEYAQLSLSFQNGHNLSHIGHIYVLSPRLPQISDL